MHFEAGLDWVGAARPDQRGGLIANFSDFPNGFSPGGHREEALAQAADLLETMVTNYMAEGWGRPEPRGRWTRLAAHGPLLRIL
ncbi:MAG: hypothetical protein JO139_16410 [Alphaproteobacteria bacterium]|nr:hypothetical protein [Alphaproteobacteria bacterium]